MKRLAMSLVCLAVIPPAARAETTPPVGRKVDAFELEDFRGTKHGQAGRRGRQPVGGRLSRHRMPAGQALRRRDWRNWPRKYAPRGVTFSGIDANRQDSLTEIGGLRPHARHHVPPAQGPGQRRGRPDRRRPHARGLCARRGPQRCATGVGSTISTAWAHVRAETDAARLWPTRSTQLLAGKKVSRRRRSGGLLIGRVRKPKPGREVTYTKQIAADLAEPLRRVPSRRARSAPFALTSYDEVAGWAETIAEVVRDGRMPPWHANPEYRPLHATTAA